MPGIFLRSFLMALSAEDPDCEVHVHTLEIAPLFKSPKAPFLPMPVAEETVERLRLRHLYSRGAI